MYQKKPFAFKLNQDSSLPEVTFRIIASAIRIWYSTLALHGLAREIVTGAGPKSGQRMLG